MHDHPDTMYTIATARHHEDVTNAAAVHEATHPRRQVRQRWRLLRRRERAAPAELAPSAILAR